MAGLTEGAILSATGYEYKTIVLTRRVKSPGVLETMSEQLPEVRNAFMYIHEQLEKRLGHLGASRWRVVSHSHSIYNGILIVSVIIQEV
jgi:hypothetical protein